MNNVSKRGLALLALACAPLTFAATPAKPAIDWFAPDQAAGQPVTIQWNMWWGNNGDSWALKAGEQLLCSGLLTPNGQQAQSGQCTRAYEAGNYALQLSLCLGQDCVSSDSKTLRVSGASNTAPALSLQLPASAGVGQPVILGASASDADGDPVRVSFSADGQLLATVAQPPYAVTAQFASAGTVSISARAEDGVGGVTERQASLTVEAAPCVDCNSAPQVQISAPAAAQPGQLLDLSAQASDSDGQVVSLSLYRDNDLLATAAGSSVAAQWQAQAGDHSLRAVAEDDKGARTEVSAPLRVVSAQCGLQPRAGGGYSLCQSDLDQAEAGLTSDPLFARVKASIRTRDNAVVEAIVPGAASNPANVRRVESILNQAQWNHLFPLANDEYTYTRFLRAVGKFEGICADYPDGRNAEAICRKSLATMFAHFTQETGAHDPNSAIEQWRQGLYFVREAGCSETGPGCGYNAECSPDTWQGKTWPCGRDTSGQFKKYYGRGAKQLSYNYNYGPFSEALFGDVRVLLDDPDRVATSWLNLASAGFFFVYPQSPKPSMLHVVDGTWVPNGHDLSLGIAPGFGATTNIINGGIECNTQGAEKPQSLNRIAYYQGLAGYLQVPIGADEQLGCANQGRFDTQGAGALLIYWDQDWGWYPGNPDGKSFACKLVGYQTAYNALTPGSYRQCVQHYFDVTVLP